MTDRTALIRSILSTPDDDLPRLVFADYCDENGEPERAAFIRTQIELSKVGDRMCGRCENFTSWFKWTKRCRGDICKLRRREYLTSRRFTVWDWCQGIPPGTRNIYRRGFVEQIRAASLDELLGGPCGVCRSATALRLRDVRLNLDPNFPEIVCPYCDGTGQVPEKLTTIFAAHPVGRVEVADREPYPHHDVGIDWGHWYDDGRPDQLDDDGELVHPASELPTEVFDRLTGGELNPSQFRHYSKRTDATSDLSASLTDMGREKAGLPPISGNLARCGHD